MAVTPRKALGVPEMLEQDFRKVCFYQIMPLYSSNGLCYCMCIYLAVKQIPSRVFTPLKIYYIVGVLLNLQTVYEKREKRIRTC